MWSLRTYFNQILFLISYGVSLVYLIAFDAENYG